MTMLISESAILSKFSIVHIVKNERKTKMEEILITSYSTHP